MTIITITGPSCSGKTTLEAELVKTPGFSRVISHTTRKPRPGEVHGASYFFVPPEEFGRMIAEGDFVEVVQFGEHHYGAAGSQFTDIMNRGEHPVIVVEPNGRDAIESWAASHGHRVMPVFLTNPTNVLAKRFLDRMTVDLSLAMGKNDGSAQDVLARYAERLDLMMGEEREWGPSSAQFGINVHKFDESNMKAVVEVIQRTADILNEKGAAELEV